MLSEKDLEKTAKEDSSLFIGIEKEYPSLKKYKEKIIKQFKKHYQLINDLVFKAHKGNLYEYSLVINGAILRSLNFYRGLIWALGKRNPHVLSDSLRGQCETLALIHYCVLKPEYVKAAIVGEREHENEEFRIVNALTMVDKLDKKYKGIRKDYDNLSELTHPNPKSLYANILAVGKTDNGKKLKIKIATKSLKITDKDADKILRLLIFWTDWIFEELEVMSRLFKNIIEKG